MNINFYLKKNPVKTGWVLFKLSHEALEIPGQQQNAGKIDHLNFTARSEGSAEIKKKNCNNDEKVKGPIPQNFTHGSNSNTHKSSCQLHSDL